MQRKILVVEDDPDQLEALRLTLKSAGYAVGAAANGNDALAKTGTDSPDLIVMDLMLPGQNGFDLCEKLRRDPATAAVPIIMMTGWHSEISRLTGLENGASEFLFKPFDPQQLVARIEELLNRPPAATAGKSRKKMAAAG